jgi:tetratricopeptide (TPR) repeat protein
VRDALLKASFKVLAEQRQPEQAIACFDKALALDPQAARAWFGKGEVLFHLGRQEDAKACFDRAMKIDPQCAAEWARECFDKAQRKPPPKL